MSFLGSSIDKINHGLNYATLKNQTISNNIANVDTANYSAKKVSFQSLLDQERHGGFTAKRTDERHLDFGRGQSGFNVVRNRNTQYNHNGNNVDIDVEMSELAENQIYYQALIERLNGQFNNLQTVIRGGS